MVSLARFWGKRADVPHAAGISPEHARFNEALKADALRRLLGIGLAGAGAGAGVGLLAHFLGRKQLPRPESDDPDVDVPYPQLKAGGVPATALATPAALTGIGAAYGAVRSPDRPGAGAAYGAGRGAVEGAGAGLGLLGGDYAARRSMGITDEAKGWKQALALWLGRAAGSLAGDRLGAAAGGAAYDAAEVTPPWKKRADWADSLTHALMPTTAGKPVPAVGSPRWARGDGHTQMTSMPWVLPAAAAAGLGGLYGGNALVRHLLTKRRKGNLDAEVEAAKKEYEEAMMAQYDPKRLHKLGGAAPAANRLDAAFDALAKHADFNDALGAGAGTYLALAAVLAGGTGVGLYKHLRSHSKSKLLADALKQRALARGTAGPPDVFLHPTPAHVDESGRVTEDAGSDPTKSLSV